jgi:hypothetical protein
MRKSWMRREANRFRERNNALKQVKHSAAVFRIGVLLHNFRRYIVCRRCDK